MAYRDLVQQLGEQTATKVLTIYSQWSAGGLTDQAFTATLVAIIGSARLRAAALADLGLSATLTARLGRVVPPVASGVKAETDRLGRAADTLLERLPDTPDPEARVKRLGLAETVSAAIVAYSMGIKRHNSEGRSPRVIGWTRSTSPTACELCRYWAEDGTIFPTYAEMAHHPGCTCTQVIVTK